MRCLIDSSTARRFGGDPLLKCLAIPRQLRRQMTGSLRPIRKQDGAMRQFGVTTLINAAGEEWGQRTATAVRKILAPDAEF
jgi:hypothetical protein